MPLSLNQVKVKAIVDWNIEWRKEGNSEREYGRNPIRRGMIVRVDGDPQMEMVEGIWVTFGKELGKDQFESNGVTVKCVKVPAREMNLVADPDNSKMPHEAWKRTFNIPDHVGTIYQSKTAKSAKAKIVDELQLTGAPSQGPITDGPSSIKEDDED